MEINLTNINKKSSNLLPQLQESCHLFSLYFRLPILIGSRESLPIQEFQQRALLIEKIQVYYRTDYLASLLAGETQTIHVLNDPLGSFAILALIQDTAILIGPFVTSLYQEKTSRQILSRYFRCDEKLLLHFKLYWCEQIICDLEAVLHAVQTILESAGLSPDDFSIMHSRLSKSNSREIKQGNDDPIPDRNFSSFQKVEDRYSIETELMFHIANGKEDAAIASLRQLLLSSRPQLAMTIDLWPNQSASAIMRNVIRLAAKNSGLDSVIIDSISLDYAQKMRNLAGNHRAEARLYENMISDLCREIRLMKETGYSPLTRQALHLLQTHYSESLTVGQLARLLHVSESTLARSLKSDTGHSFTELLKIERMQIAAHLLVTTSDSVQGIAEKVGIADSNYFIKVFRSIYHQTPGEYRIKKNTM